MFYVQTSKFEIDLKQLGHFLLLGIFAAIFFFNFLFSLLLCCQITSTGHSNKINVFLWLLVTYKQFNSWRHDTQHNDIQHNDTQQTTLSITTFSTTTLGKWSLHVTLSTNDTHHKRHSAWQCPAIMLSVTFYLLLWWVPWCWVSLCRSLSEWSTFQVLHSRVGSWPYPQT